MICAIIAGCSGTGGGGGAPPPAAGNPQPNVAATGIAGAAGTSTSGQKAPLAGAAQPARAPSGPAFKMPSMHFQAPHISVHLHH
ncbi:MAG TPA: hypothetical protein VEV38_05830 [Candidatus Eremiobacteraceae bacterium]|nr:hypothetical protein [Candidatus Eremiobacteraceae bacterium]